MTSVNWAVFHRRISQYRGSGRRSGNLSTQERAMMTNADDRRAVLNTDVLAHNPEVAGQNPDPALAAK
jgi:hypothetical protein